MLVSGHTPATLTPSITPPPQPLVNRHSNLGGPQNQSKRFGEVTSLSPMRGTEPQFVICLAHSLVNIPTTMSRLLFIAVFSHILSPQLLRYKI